MSDERRPTPVVAEEGPDAGVPWHYGDPVREQRAIERGVGRVDLSHRGVLRVTGPDRLTWLHSLTTQHLLGLQPGQGTTVLVLSPQGHLEHTLYGVDDGTSFWAHTEPGAAAAAAAWLDSMRFMMRVEVADLTDAVAVVWSADPDVVEPAALVVRRAADSLGRRRAARPPRPAGGRPGRRPAGRDLGVRGAAHRRRRPAHRPRHRRPHDPQRGRPDRRRGAPRQGLLPRSGDGRPGPHPRTAAAPAGAAAPRRQRRTAAGGRFPAGARRPRGRLRGHVGPPPRARARSPWGWSSGTSTSRPPCSPTASPRRRRRWSTRRSGCTSDPGSGCADPAPGAFTREA